MAFKVSKPTLATALFLTMAVAQSALAADVCSNIFDTPADVVVHVQERKERLGSENNPLEMRPRGQTRSEEAYQPEPGYINVQRPRNEVQTETRPQRKDLGPDQSFRVPRKQPVAEKNNQPVPEVKESEGFFSKMFSIFKGKDVRSEITFIGEPLSPVQFKLLARQVSKEDFVIEKGDVITVIQYEMMERQFVSPYNFRTVVEKNGPFENVLLEHSLIDSKPREALSIRLHTISGRIIETGILITGTIDSVSGAQTRAHLIAYLQRNQVEGLKAIEVAHTHPQYAVGIKSPDRSQVHSMHDISRGDVMAGTELLHQLPDGMEVIIKAILPNGFHYINRLK